MGVPQTKLYFPVYFIDLFKKKKKFIEGLLSISH